MQETDFVKGVQEANKRKGSAKSSLQFSGFILVCAGEKMHEVLCATRRSSVLSLGSHTGAFPDDSQNLHGK